MKKKDIIPNYVEMMITDKQLICDILGKEDFKDQLDTFVRLYSSLYDPGGYSTGELGHGYCIPDELKFIITGYAKYGGDRWSEWPAIDVIYKGNKILSMRHYGRASNRYDLLSIDLRHVFYLPQICDILEKERQVQGEYKANERIRELDEKAVEQERKSWMFDYVRALIDLL